MMMKNFDVSGLVTWEEALEKLFRIWQPEPSRETVPVAESCGRVLAEDVFARYTIPVVRAAMMDSVALRSSDFAGGAPDTSGWRRGVEFERADMGDDFDDRFDAAVPVESVEFLPSGGIALRDVETVRPGDGIRTAGTTASAGELLLRRGSRLSPSDLGALLAGGILEVVCFQKPLVAVIPTGSELIAPGTAPGRGENINANSVMLRQMLLEMGAQPLCLPIVRDVPGQMAEVLEEALHRADIVVVNAGSSKGEEDFSTRLLRGTDTFLFHGVRAVPGRPLSIAVAQGKPVVNLPGPPMAAFNGADWCLRAVVARFLHTAPDEPRSVQAVLTAPLDGPKALRFTSRMEVYRSEGTVYARPVPREEGSTARTMAANGYYASPVGEGRLESGDVIRVSLLRGIEER